MATIPIEVIVQDKASPEPTPTPSDSGETNIVVPDTGAGVVGSGSAFASSSVASVILPAILLIVALFTICTLLIRKRHKRQDNDKFSKKEKLITATSTTIAVLSATVLVGNLVIPATKAATNVEPGTADLETEDKITIIATREQDSDEVVATVKNTSYATANLDFGYKVTASMAEGLATANLYLDGDETSEYYIAPVEDGVLEDNTWGYRLSEEGEDYLTIPLANAPATIIKGNDNTIEDKPVDIYYTIKADKSLPAGTYTGEIEYTLADNNFPATLTTMQGMTTEICESTYTPNAFKADGITIEDNVPTVILKDIRDNKMYRVAKLADGKCWMTQNLDLQKESLVVASLDSTNTDNPADGFELPNSQTDGSGSWSGSESAVDTSHVYDIAASGETYKYCLDYRGYCAEYGDDIPAEELGNLYNWYSATAGTGTYSTGGTEEGPFEATGSICPAGWRLPNNSNTGAATDYSILLARYGILESPTSSIYYSEDKEAIYKAPFLLVPNGSYVSQLGGVGISGSIWSSLARSNYGTSFFSFSVGNAFPWQTGSGGSKVEGYATRCLAR